VADNPSNSDATRDIAHDIAQDIIKMQLIDANGKIHARVGDGAPCRIVSLVPSITELLCELGLAPQLVGRTGFCIHPKQLVAAIPKVGGTKDVNIEKIRRLAPTHLVVNIDENEKPTVDALSSFIPNVIVTHPLSPLDNPPLFRLLGGVFGCDNQAETLCSQFEAALASLQQRLHLHQASQRQTGAKPNRVLYCIWQDPWMTVSSDTYIARMLELIGWQHWISDSPARYPEFQWNEALLANIDEVLLSSEPYRFTEHHVDALERQIGKPVRLVDGEMLSWYGSRSIKGLAYLSELAGGD
jgi:ABC-type Fe3+-hydroxamate transport system substrate-binding protein